MKTGTTNKHIGWWKAGCVLGLGIVMVVLVGCGQNLEENPTILALAKQVEDVEFQLKTVRTDIESMYDDVSTLKQKANSVEDSSAKLNAMDQRLAKIEKELAGVGAAVEQLKKVKPVAREVAAEAMPGSQQPTARPEVAQETYAKPKGFYYTIQKDDTLESIAKKYDVSTGELLLKNRLPAGVTLYPGQQIFIPKAPQ